MQESWLLCRNIQQEGITPFLEDTTRQTGPEPPSPPQKPGCHPCTRHRELPSPLSKTASSDVTALLRSNTSNSCPVFSPTGRRTEDPKFQKFCVKALGLKLSTPVPKTRCKAQAPPGAAPLLGLGLKGSVSGGQGWHGAGSPCPGGQAQHLRGRNEAVAVITPTHRRIRRQQPPNLKLQTAAGNSSVWGRVLAGLQERQLPALEVARMLVCRAPTATAAPHPGERAALSAACAVCRFPSTFYFLMARSILFPGWNWAEFAAPAPLSAGRALCRLPQCLCPYPSISPQAGAGTAWAVSSQSARSSPKETRSSCSSAKEKPLLPGLARGKRFPLPGTALGGWQHPQGDAVLGASC